MKYDLFTKRSNEFVGEAVVFPSGRAMFHLWKNIRLTQEATEEQLKKRYVLRPTSNLAKDIPPKA